MIDFLGMVLAVAVGETFYTLVIVRLLIRPLFGQEIERRIAKAIAVELRGDKTQLKQEADK